jgi:hypothetical protein
MDLKEDLPSKGEFRETIEARVEISVFGAIDFGI